MEKETKSEWHYVKPKKDCPHIKDLDIVEVTKGITKKKCGNCEETSENWLCLTCGAVECSRYKNKHMVEHIEKNPSHCVSVSFSDLSFWCFKCDSYIVANELKETYLKLSEDKFGKKNPVKDKNDLTEYFDKKELFDMKVKKVAQLVKNSKYTVVYTGAGISTSASIPDYRGPNGVWTCRDEGRKVNFKIKLSDARPTYTHNALAKLCSTGQVKSIISTNVDGLHMKSGVDLKTQLSELHGNIFKEICQKCSKVYIRDFDTTSGNERFGLSGHETGRDCECGGKLGDSIIHFGEDLPQDALKFSIRESDRASLSIVMGTSLKVQPACSFPFYCKKNGGNVVIVNLQKTPYDGDCDLKVYAKCDEFMKALTKELDVDVK